MITKESLARVATEQAQPRQDNRKSKKRAPSTRRMTPTKDNKTNTMDKEGG